MHVLKSLCAQLIALHYMNRFFPTYSHMLLKPKSKKMTQTYAPMHVFVLVWFGRFGLAGLVW